MANSIKPKVSVVIPAYNAEQFVSEAIESVLNQSYENIQCIVINDGSTDDTSAKVKSFGNDVVLLEQDNMGVSYARNNGINRANGEWIAFLDADDIWHPDKLSVQLDELSNTNSSTLLHSTNINIERDHLSSCNYFDLISFPKHQQTSLLKNPGVEQLKYHFSWLQNTIVHNSLLEKTGLVFNINRSLYEDFEWLLNLSLYSSWKVTDRVLVDIKRRNNSQDCLSAERERNKIGAVLGMLDILLTFKQRIRSNPVLLAAVNREISKQYSHLGNLYRSAGAIQEAKRTYLEGFRNTMILKLLVKYLWSQLKLGY